MFLESIFLINVVNFCMLIINICIPCAMLWFCCELLETPNKKSMCILLSFNQCVKQFVEHIFFVVNSCISTMKNDLYFLSNVKFML